MFDSVTKFLETATAFLAVAIPVAIYLRSAIGADLAKVHKLLGGKSDEK